MYIQPYGVQNSSGLGWFIDTRIGTAKTPAGHEILTEQAARGVITNRADLTALLNGARRPDLANPQDHIKARRGETTLSTFGIRTVPCMLGFMPLTICRNCTSR
jgi:hypothetical protein